MLIIHGDNVVGSRNLLNQKIDNYKIKGVKDIVRLDGKKVKIEDLKQAFESNSLFGGDKLIIIEGIFGRPKSKEKSVIENYLNSSNLEACLIWESKKLNITQTKNHKNATIQEFKTPTVIFSFLDSLGSNIEKSTKLLNDCLEIDTAGSIFFMLARHIRLLLQSQSAIAKLPSWQRPKLTQQLKSIGIEKIISVHTQLLNIDERLKTGKSALDLTGELELLLAKLYY